MTNIFAELKKGNDQNEDYFTRSFATLLREIPPLTHHLIREFVGGECEPDDECEIKLFEKLGNAGEIDMVIKSPSVGIFIENKTIGGLSGDDQLVKYDNYIRKHYPESKFIFISNFYIDDESIYLTDKYLRWSEVYSIIEDFYTQKEEGLNEKEKYLIKQFLKFMKGEGMSDEKVSWEVVNGVKSLTTLRDMIKSVLEEQIKEGRIKKINAGSGNAWLGFKVGIFSDETDMFWMGLIYREPDEIYFGPDGDKHWENFDPDNAVENLSLEFEDTHFLALKKEEQKEEIRKYVKERLDTFHEHYEKKFGGK